DSGDPRRAAAGDRGPRPGVRPLRAPRVLVRGPPRRAVGERRPNQPVQLLHAVPLVPPAGPPRRLGRAAARRRPRVLPTDVDRPEPLPARPPPTPGARRLSCGAWSGFDQAGADGVAGEVEAVAHAQLG